MKSATAFLNGQWIPAAAAAVPVSDAGFVLGVTVAEQLRTFAGKLFHLDSHLDRLAHSLEIIGVKPDMTLDEMAATASELVARNHSLLASGDDLGLSVFVTPGVYPSYAECDKAGEAARPTVCMHTYALPFHLWARKYREGQALVTTDVEQVSARCWPAGVKCRSRMHYYLADQQAAALDPRARALLLDSQGFVTEASTANVLVYSAADGLISPPTSKVLRGISLSTVAALAQRLGISWAERELTSDDVASADEVLLTSTPMCLLPVTRFNGRPISAGEPGPIFARLIRAWSDFVGVDIAGQAERFARRNGG